MKCLILPLAGLALFLGAASAQGQCTGPDGPCFHRCPNHNRIERLWQDLHANVTRNHRHRTIRTLLIAVLHWLEARFTATAAYPHAA